MPFNDDELLFNKHLKYKLFPSKTKEREYWKNFEVNIDSYCDKWSIYKEDFEKELKHFTQADLKKICSLFHLTAKVEESDYKETLLNDVKSSVLFYCIIKFALSNPKAISREFKIQIKNGKIDRAKVFLKTLEVYKVNKLIELYLFLHAQKNGSAKFSFDVVSNKKGLKFDETKKSAETLVRFLNQTDRDHYEYHLRFSAIVNKDFLFLLLKETADKIFPALPDNTRVQLGRYLLIRLDHNGRLTVNTKSHFEANKIKNYLAKKNKVSIKYNKKYASYDSKKFFESILSESVISKNVKLLDASFRKTIIGDQGVTITDRKRKNDITHVIRWMRDKGMLKLTDFSEFRTLTFSFKGVSFSIQVHENRWGQLRLVIADQRKPAKELQDFKNAFTKAYNIPFEVFLRNKDEVTDKIIITRKIIDNRTLHSDMPEDVENILLDLINNNFLHKPISSAKRRCVSCRHVYWEKGDCPVCGNEAYFEGDYVDIEINEEHFGDYLYKNIKADRTLKAKKIKRQISGQSFPFIEVIDREGDLLSIYINKSNVPTRVVEHFEENGNSLLIILLKYKDAVQSEISEKNFECADFVEIVSNETKFIPILINKAISEQKRKWQSKIIDKADLSYKRIIKKGTSYNDQHFEKDIYNLLHEIFPIADRLGGKFAGIKAPDGIASIQDYGKPRKRFCFAWDCKFSTLQKGYQLNDRPPKHKHYLTRLNQNDTVHFFGGLSVYAFISQNMDEKKYTSFYSKLIFKSRWKGHVFLLSESNILLIYTVFKKNEALIKSYPSIFYKKIFGLLRRPRIMESEPFKFISNERIMKAMEDLKVQFRKVHKSFNFKRSDF